MRPVNLLMSFPDGRDDPWDEMYTWRTTLSCPALKLPVTPDRSYALQSVLCASGQSIADCPGVMEDTRGRWERAYVEAVDFDTWGQVTSVVWMCIFIRTAI